MPEPANETEAPDARPGPAPLQLLSWFERISFRLLRWLNGPAQKLSTIWQRMLMGPLLAIFICRRLRVVGAERLDRLPPDAPFLLVANHRTFFDLFILAWVLVRHRGLRHRVSFPVRANFFYENPLGLLFCLIFSGGSMFPPFFRSPKKRAFNAHSVELLLERLREPGNMVGFHPEGTRSKGGDPYGLLPAQPGAGKLVLDARPIVVPAFVTGLSDSLGHELWSNIRGTEPVIAVFGEPLDPSRWPEGSRLALQKRCSDDLLDRIRELQAEERAVRAGPMRKA